MRSNKCVIVLIVLLLLVVGGSVPPPVAEADSYSDVEAAIAAVLIERGSPLAGQTTQKGESVSSLLAGYAVYWDIDPALLLALIEARADGMPLVIEQPFFASETYYGFHEQLAAVVGEIMSMRSKQTTAEETRIVFEDGWQVTLDHAAHRGDWLAARLILAYDRASYQQWAHRDAIMRSRYADLYHRLSLHRSARGVSHALQHATLGDQAHLRLVAAPTVSREQYIAIYQQAGSPASNEANAMYSVLLAQGIDPAIQLAFARKETQFGKAGQCAPLRNLHCVSCNEWDAAYGATCGGRFSSYPNYTSSVRAWAALMKAYDAAGLTTPRLALPVYAPRFENDTDGYICDVEQWVMQWRAGR